MQTWPAITVTKAPTLLTRKSKQARGKTELYHKTLSVCRGKAIFFFSDVRQAFVIEQRGKRLV